MRLRPPMERDFAGGPTDDHLPHPRDATPRSGARPLADGQVGGTFDGGGSGQRPATRRSADDSEEIAFGASGGRNALAPSVNRLVSGRSYAVVGFGRR